MPAVQGVTIEASGVTGWRRSLAQYGDRRVLLILPLGFASGLPLLLTFSTLSAWLATAGVSRAAIGAFALVGTPYAFKFLWSPLIDRLPPPLPLGRRRGWGVTIQIALIAATLALGIVRPEASSRADGGAGAAGRVSFGQPGHRDRRLARRDPHAGAAGPRRRDDPDRLPDRDAGRGSGRADDRRPRRLVRGLRHDGGAAGRRDARVPVRSRASVPARPAAYRKRRMGRAPPLARDGGDGAVRRLHAPAALAGDPASSFSATSWARRWRA